MHKEFYTRPIWRIRISLQTYESYFFPFYDLVWCSAGVLRSSFVPTVESREARFIPLMTWRREWGGGTAYGSASYIKEATGCAVIHCQFALFVSCNPSCLPTLPGDSAAVTKAPVWFLPQVRPLWNLLLMSYYTVSTAKLAFYFGMGFLLSVLGRAMDWVHIVRPRYHLQHRKWREKKGNKQSV